MSRPVDPREIIRLAGPALGSLAADPLVTLVDTAFVGRLGADALASLGVDAAIFGLAFVAFNFLQYGVTPMVGRLVGAGRPGDAADVTRHALVIGLGLGLVVAAVLAFAARPLIALMAAPPESVEGAVEYLRIRAWAAPAVMVIMVGNGAFRGHQDTMTPLKLTLVLNGVNLVADPILIFGLGWGLAGAATATVGAQLIGAALFAVAMVRRRHLEWGPVTGAGLRPFGRVGWELAVRTGSLVATLTLAARVAAGLGTVAIAAHQVAMQLWLFLTLVLDALAIAAQSMVSLRMGTGDLVGVRAVARALLRWGTVVGVVLALAVLALRPVLPGWFTTDAEVAATIAGLLWWVAALQLPGAWVFVWDGLFLGAGRFGFLAAATAAASAAGIGVLAAVGPAGWGVGGVWAGVAVLIAGRLLTLVWGDRTGRLVSVSPG
ncbi:MAG: MATE family efflux transporter [Acidimicrobiia bacterium]